MTLGKWRTMRVVVELPVRGRLSETELCYVIDEALGRGDVERSLPLDADAGTPRVKSYRRVMQADMRKQMATKRDYWGKR